MDGFTFQYLWPDYPVLNTNATSVFGSLSLFFAAWFSITFLRTLEYAPRYHRFLVGLTIILGIFSFVAIFIETGVANQVVQVLPFILSVTILPIAVYVVWQGHLAARYFLLGWGLLYLLLGYFSAATIGWVGTTYFPMDMSHSPMDIVRVAIIIEAVALSLGLADQYRRLNDDNKRNQAELVDQLQARLDESRERAQLKLEKEAALRDVFDKSRVLASASHDIAQPIRSLRLALDSKSNNIHDPEILSSVTTTLDDMEAVISDALQEASGALKEASQDIVANIGQILSEVVSSFQDEVMEKGLYIRMFAPMLSANISVISLKRSLTNLVSNAIHCTHEGGILIAARKRGNGILIQVFDTGIGLTEADQESLLKFHEKSNNSLGYGLGLAIVNEICLATGWEFVVRSKVNKGSCFSIYMPDCIK